MASLNKVTLIGNLGRDPEMRTFPSGDQVANVSVACTDKWKDKQTGEIKEHTEWVRLVFNGRLAEIAGQYLFKGSQIYIEGSLRTRKWTDQAGVEKYATEVRVDQLIMLGQPGGSNGNQRGGGQQGGYDDGGYDNGGYDQGGNNGGRQQPQQRQQQGNQRQGNQGGGGQRQQGNGGGNGSGQQRQAQQQQRGPQQNQQRPQQNQQAQQPPQRADSGFGSGGFDDDTDIPF